MSSDLESLGNKLVNLSDGQYKLVNESILAALHTVDEEKLKYLRRVVKNAAHEDINMQEASALSRLVRDLSASEVRFLLEHETVERFMLCNTLGGEEDAMHIHPQSELGLVANGLLSCGLLMAAEPTWDDSGRLRYAPIVPRLIGLLREGNA